MTLSNPTKLQQILQSDQDFNLAEAALLIAETAYPDVDIQHNLDIITDITDTIRDNINDLTDSREIIETMNRVLFKEYGFKGNIDEYYDPRNSYLNDVLDRKLGIPITLSVIYMEVASRLGLHLEGTSFPGHFLLKLEVNQGAIILDPFYGGISLDESELTSRMNEVLGNDQSMTLQQALTPCNKHDILIRMLNNLLNIHVSSQNWHHALLVINNLLIANPEQAELYKSRAYVYENLDCFRAAADDYSIYLNKQPDAADFQPIRDHLMELQQKSQRLN